MKYLSQGDWVDNRKQKPAPRLGRGPRAGRAFRGDTYSYFVDKLWVINGRLNDDQVLLVTRTGKGHVVAIADPNLHPARWWERWMYGDRLCETEKLVEGYGIFCDRRHMAR